MKTTKTTILVLALICISLKISAQSETSISQNQETGISPFIQNWLQKAEDHLRDRAFYIMKSETSDAYKVSNSSQHLGFFISPKGYKTFPLNYSKKNRESNVWEQTLTFSEIRRGENRLLITSQCNVVLDKSLLRFDYPSFSIEYKNDNNGLRQNFIIAQKPRGNENLELLLNIQGSMKSIIKENSLRFEDENGNVKLFYTDLKVWDANHKSVNASMQWVDNQTLAIVVKDQQAVYPLTIDPLNKTPEWTTSADGILPALVGQLAVDAAYGFTVAGLGDINGDGFDDVAIGSPAAADVIAGTGTLAAVGAVFIYHGSATGLPTIPDAVLQPNTVVAGALFGYSIAGGDINNDGKNDVLIGAPLDEVTIDIGGGSTANGTVGKVYAFDGPTLTSGSSPLLTLQLDGSGILENGVNLSVNALFGFSVSVTEDLNNDNVNDIIVGAPTYAGVGIPIIGPHFLDAQSGGAFVFMSNGGSHILKKLTPLQTGLLGLPILTNNINGLLFGYSVDGLGDYNGDGYADVIATAPAGIDAGTISGLLTGQLLQGSAIVYYGTGTDINSDPGAVLVASAGGLLTALSGTISNIANLFGVAVRGVRDPSGVRNGNVLVGAPLGGVLRNILGLDLKTGTVSVFVKKSSSPSGNVAPDQQITSPRDDNTILGLIQSNLLFGFSLDNVFDINCDGIGDIIVGEPVSSGLHLLNTSIAGGAAYVYLGKADGTYDVIPIWSVTATEDAFLGINATSLIGYSVAGAGHVRGSTQDNRILIGTPSRTLDFGAGLLNLGATLGTLFSLTSGDNGVGKAYLFNLPSPCVGTHNTNPDFNSTFINVPVPGNVNTNDNVPIGSTYGTPNLVSSPGGSTPIITMNADGTYEFQADVPGVYTYEVPVCQPGQPAPCPTSLLTINVLDNTVRTNPPVANVDIATTPLNTPVTLKTLANDQPGYPSSSLDPASVTIINGPSHGTTSINPVTGDITYTPTTGYIGPDTLEYQVCDDQSPAKCATALQIINTLSSGSDNTTTAADDYVITLKGTDATGNVKTNDIDAEGDAQTVTPQTSNIKGKGTLVLLDDGSYTFTPDADYTGPVDFIYTTCDDGSPQQCANATLHILVMPIIFPLPIKLTSFTAVKQNSVVQLSWETTSEINSSYFEVQTSVDGINWVSIGTVQAAGTSTTSVHYSFVHHSPVDAVNYYRLKIYDIDTRYEYSLIRAVNFNKNGSITIMPNPTTGNIYITSNNNEAVQVVEIYSTTGKLIRKIDGFVFGNTIDLSNYSNGLYFIYIKDRSGHTETVRVLKK